mmetsp:Transcript_2302/g.3476  ORF Transcript_2302/g.3476 Transcript_2302/m.3476 type:complete len:84 (+) Transcript_2302:559-810(+)
MLARPTIEESTVENICHTILLEGFTEPLALSNCHRTISDNGKIQHYRDILTWQDGQEGTSRVIESIQVYFWDRLLQNLFMRVN